MLLSSRLRMRALLYIRQVRWTFNVAHPTSGLVSPLLTSTRFNTSTERWTCSCGFSNFAFRGACFHCQAANPQAPIATGSDDAMPSFSLREEDQNFVSKHFEDKTHPKAVPMRSGDWRCQCGAHNFSRRTNCFSCGSPKNGEINFNIKPGDWICLQCNSHNFKSRVACYSCNAAKPQVAVEGSSLVGEAVPPGRNAAWTCQSCHSMNDPNMSSCYVCTAARPAAVADHPSTTPFAGSAQVQKTYKNDWVCPSCTFVNFQTRMVCKSCGVKKPAETEAIPGGATPQGFRQEKDWVCGCGFVNFQFRTACKQCQQLKPSSNEMKDDAVAQQQEQQL